MILLDTNVMSELMRAAPGPQVSAWVAEQQLSAAGTTAVTAAELRAGIAVMPNGRRRANLEDTLDEVLLTFRGRVLPFDQAAATDYGDVIARRRTAGRPIGALDAQIAAICRVHRATLATRNTKDFEGLDLELIDPWTA